MYIRLFIVPNYNGGISQLEIRASPFSYQNSGGLCGYFDQNPANDQFVLTNNVASTQVVNRISITNVAAMANFWR